MQISIADQFDYNNLPIWVLLLLNSLSSNWKKNFLSFTPVDEDYMYVRLIDDHDSYKFLTVVRGRGITIR